MIPYVKLRDNDNGVNDTGVVYEWKNDGTMMNITRSIIV